MLYHFLTQYVNSCRACGLFNLFTYISFRSVGAALTGFVVAILIGKPIIVRLRAMKVRQVVRQGTPDTHLGKGNTPTMGGVIVIIGAVVPTLLWARLDNRYVWIALLVTVWMGAIGFLDDYLKLKQKREGQANVGLVERYKLAGQIVIGVALGIWLWKAPLSTLPGASTTLPFYKYVLLVPMTAGLAWLYVPWVAFVLTGASNAVNLTDGLDGLATGLTAIAAATFAIFAYIIGRIDTSEYLRIFYLRGAGELTVFCSTLFGALIGFLWYNTHPA
ncbi:MAG: phospho-N-acetylmuramoyl-pentapeptide-transferase, partial [Gemmatimonadaceae bacterium]